jgi:LacI family transcriptional regulator
MTAKRFCDILVTRGVHGILIGRMPPGRHELDLLWERFSVVALGLTLHSPRLHHVTENHFDTALQAMRQCRARGYRRVGFAFTDANDSPGVGDRWLGAYLSEQRQYAPEDRLPVCPGFPATADEFCAWFDRQQPDALLVTHAAPACGWLRRLGKQVRRDIGLVELENHPDEGSSGIFYDPAKIGALAIEMLIGLMHRNEKGVPENPYEVLVSGEWREGRTLPTRR